MYLLLVIKIVLVVTGLYLTNHQVVMQLTRFIDYNLYFPLLVFFGIWITSLLAVFYIAFTPRTVERVAWTVLICAAVLFGETYFLVVEERLTISALDAMWGPGYYSLETLTFYGKYLFEALLRVAPLFAGLLIPWKTIKVLAWPGLVAIPLVPYGLLSGLVYYASGAGGMETRGVPSQFLIPGLMSVFTASGPAVFEKGPVDIPIDRPAAVKHIILLVDESVSGDFIDLNVQRGVTPFLMSQEKSVVNFGLALSASNCSTASNAILRLGANPDLLGTSESEVLANPSIWKYANDAGFETNYIEAQLLSKNNLNFMNKLELALIDHVESFDDNAELSQRDLQLVGQIAAILSRPTPQFIYVNKFGVHFPYNSSYPTSETVFKPSMKHYETIADRERLVNSYKNSIRWSVDHFFKQLIQDVDFTNSVMIYTSDHGQSLLDDNLPTTHCRRHRVSRFEAVVPLLVWTGDAGLHHEFALAAEKNRGRASHFEIFPTILELFGYNPPTVAARYTGSLFREIQLPLGFTSGPIIGRFERKATWHPRGDLDTLAR